MLALSCGSQDTSSSSCSSSVSISSDCIQSSSDGSERKTKQNKAKLRRVARKWQIDRLLQSGARKCARTTTRMSNAIQQGAGGTGVSGWAANTHTRKGLHSNGIIVAAFCRMLPTQRQRQRQPLSSVLRAPAAICMARPLLKPLLVYPFFLFFLSFYPAATAATAAATKQGARVILFVGGREIACAERISH